MSDSKNDPSLIKIFYAHSTRNSNSLYMYENFCKLLNNDKYTIQNPTETPLAYNLASKILDQIDESDLFIADITPDDVKIEDMKTEDGKIAEKRTYTFNPHVMCELQHASARNLNIIILYDKNALKNRSDIPIFFQANNTQEYQNCDDAVKDIIEYVENYGRNEVVAIKRYNHINFVDNEAVMSILNIATGCKITKAAISYDSKTNSIVLFCHHMKGLHGIIYLRTMKYLIVSRKTRKWVDLSYLKDLASELKHIEVVSLLKWSLRPKIVI